MNPLKLSLVILLPALLIGSMGANLGRTAPAVKAASPPLLLTPELVFDTADGRTHAGWAVLVTGNLITAAGPAAQISAPAGAVTVQLPGMTLVPGLMDIHSHIFLHPYNETSWNDQVLKEPLAYRTIAASVHAKDTLMAGFT